MAVLRDLTIRIRPVVEGGGFRDAQMGTRGVGTAAKTATVSVVAMGTALGQLASKAILFGLRSLKGAIGSVTTEFAAQGDELAKFAKATGLTVEALQELAFAGQFSGISTADLNKSLLNLGKRARDAATGAKKPAEAFKELGIEIRNTSGGLKTQEQLLLEVADRFEKLPQGTSKSALAMEIFGKAGAKIIPFLNEGSAGIQKLRNEARALGGVMSSETAAATEGLADSQLRLQIILRGLRIQIASKLIPPIIKIITRFTDWAKEGDNLARLINGAEKAIKGFVATLAILGAIKLTSFFAGFISLGPAILVVGALLIGLQEIVKLARGEDGLLTKFLGDEKAVGGLRDAFAAVVAAAKQAAAVILPALAQIVAAFAPIVASIAVTLAGVLQDLAPVIASVVTQLAPVIATVLTLISEVLKDLQPLIVVFLESVSQIVKELLPVMQELFAALAPIIKDLVKALGPLLKVLIKVFGRAVIAAVRALAFVLKLLKPIINIISQALRELGPAAGATFGLMEKAISAVGRALAPIVALFKEIARRISAAGKAVKDFVGDVEKIPGVGTILRFAAPEAEGGTRARGRLAGGGASLSAVQGLRSQRIQGVTTGSTTTQTTNVGGVTVNVKSQASPAEIGTVLEKTIKDLRRRAMEDISPSSRSALSAALK